MTSIDLYILFSCSQARTKWKRFIFRSSLSTLCKRWSLISSLSWWLSPVIVSPIITFSNDESFSEKIFEFELASNRIHYFNVHLLRCGTVKLGVICLRVGSSLDCKPNTGGGLRRKNFQFQS